MDNCKFDGGAHRIFGNTDEYLDCLDKGETVFLPYVAMDYGFYKIIYDDAMKKSMKSKVIWK